MKLSNDNNITRREFVRNTAAAMAAVSACNVSTAYAEDKAKERWNMKLATSSVMFEDLPIEQVCERAARLGLTGLDIWGPFGKCQHLEDIKKRLDGKGLRELMTKYKLDVAAFTAWGANIHP